MDIPEKGEVDIIDPKKSESKYILYGSKAHFLSLLRIFPKAAERTVCFVDPGTGEGTVPKNVKECLVFAESGLDVPAEILDKHCFVFSDNPQGAYAKFTEEFFAEEEKENIAIGYDALPNGVFVGKNVVIGENVINLK